VNEEKSQAARKPPFLCPRIAKNPGSGKIPVQEKSRFRKNPGSGKIPVQEKS